MFDLLDSPTGAWIGLVAAIAVLLVVDLLVVRGRDGAMSTRQAAIASAAWVGVSVLFFVVLLVLGDDGQANAYLAGYLVEKSLSLDNVFVFLLVFSSFGIAASQRHRLLTYGIVGALVMRAGFIVAGAAVLHAFGWVSFLFAALLAATAWRIWQHRHDHSDSDAIVGRLRRWLPIAEGEHGTALTTKAGGKRLLTAGGAALAAVAVADVLFAVDSVPAILAITDDTYVVFAANAFALLGLRPLFFLVADLVERLYYLKAALAALLGFIAIKLVLGELVGKISPAISLSVIATILLVGAGASILRDRRLAREAAAVRQ
ncbi:TerC/Alx family metal homeostasis membrane protein [Conexibacter sp. SYSU D00693]|uniref:TerC/Alx family metal homeostasis membrane protein n=1 Tax=Conexibacter sp. SYSU D00693 TaxID=2812560 RepID=UPI001F11D1E7|nr:TerC/Alx family metal homeostasis membrane protein [Conexibacter sp. SYSU D00693]